MKRVSVLPAVSSPVALKEEYDLYGPMAKRRHSSGRPGLARRKERRQIHALLERIQPLPSARWASVEQPELMMVLGHDVLIQRLEAPDSRDRLAMQNRRATLLFLDPHPGIAPLHWQNGIGDVVAYRCPGPNPDGGVVFVDHLTGFDMEILSGFIEGELKCGHGLSQKNPIVSEADMYECMQRFALYESVCEEIGHAV